MRKLSDKYAIVGIGYTPQGKVPDRSTLSFHLEACANAIKDAGLSKQEIDGLIIYRYFEPLGNDYEITPYLVAQHLGIQPSHLSQEANCARSQLIHAIALLEAGFCKYVLISYADNAYSQKRSFVKEIKNEKPIDDNAVFGEFGTLAKYAMAARRGMYEFSTGPETWKDIAINQRKWANLNENAIFHHKTLSTEEYYLADFIVEPFRRFDASQPIDGGRAYIVTSIERARDLRNPPVLVMGISEDNPCVDPHRSFFMTGNTGAKKAGALALNMAGITLSDIDACQIYDCFTYTVELTLQDYGFFQPGEGKEWFSEGKTAPGGNFPINTSGGMLSESYFMGLTPLTEGVMQLMGRCGKRQLGVETNTKEPKIILCSDNGGVFQTHSTVILRRA
ncbi:MAG: thiolase family protein [Anaerolineaceae bacterium]|nr:thiolase family protein [Anaerolineaceae bacterium]